MSRWLFSYAGEMVLKCRFLHFGYAFGRNDGFVVVRCKSGSRLRANPTHRVQDVLTLDFVLR